MPHGDNISSRSSLVAGRRLTASITPRLSIVSHRSSVIGKIPTATLRRRLGQRSDVIEQPGAHGLVWFGSVAEGDSDRLGGLHQLAVGIDGFQFADSLGDIYRLDMPAA